jgi:hypothetical protein
MYPDIRGFNMDYAIRRELVQIIGELDNQLVRLKKPVMSNQPIDSDNQSDFEKIINEKCASLSENQQTNVLNNMHIHHIR